MENLSNSAKCQAKCLFALLQEMHDNGGSIQYQDIKNIVPKRIKLSDWEMEVNNKTNQSRWLNLTLFGSIYYSCAGLIVKKRGTWYITEDGESALKRAPEAVWSQCRAEFIRRNGSTDEKGTTDSAITETEVLLGIEELEAKAFEEIRLFIKQKNPYEFQDMVAALLRSMGYYTPFVAPRGKDGGVDIVAYVDALGAQTPRIKVQVKHYPENPVGAKDVRSLLGILRDGEVGVFVTSGKFSADAINEVRTNNRFVKLVNGQEFVELWQMFYNKMSDEDKALMPLRCISFLGKME